jgi:hypothetical protein
MTRAFNRFVACIAPDLTAAQGISPVFTALSVLFGGYMITRVSPLSLSLLSLCAHKTNASVSSLPLHADSNPRLVDLGVLDEPGCTSPPL